MTAELCLAGQEVSTSIGGAFTRQARLRPDEVAVLAEDGELTYDHLDRLSDGLARHLWELGARRGEVIAVSGRRETSMIVGLLAVLKLGAAYLAMDDRYPLQRKETILRHAGVRFALGPVAADVTGTPPGCEVVPLHGRWPELPAPGLAVSAEETAYVAYTSGSTGEPKGVCVPHRAVRRLVLGNDLLPVRQDDVFLQFAPLAFDASTWEVWAPLLNGARLVLAPPRDLSVDDLTRLVEQHGVTALWLTAGLFHQLTDAVLPHCRGLRHLLAGGDVLSPAQVDLVREALPTTRLVNGYGPTENTTFTCCHPVTGPMTASVPIGRPISGTGVRLLDADLRPVRDGEIGDLYATGTGLAHGYLGDAALTAARFRPDPFATEPGARMYRTGDLARALPDGSLEFHGRVDNQVKVRGFRIELGETESVIAGLPGVVEAVVVQQTSVPGDGRLIATLTGTSLSLLDIRRRLAEVLPAYAVPSVIRVMGTLPLTPNGKVDRAALSAHGSSPRPELAAGYRAPATPTEVAVAELWTDHLGITDIGADDDFFELGGHSLVGVRITGALHDAYGVEVSPVTFYLDPTPAGLASAVEKGLEKR